MKVGDVIKKTETRYGDFTVQCDHIVSFASKPAGDEAAYYPRESIRALAAVPFEKIERAFWTPKKLITPGQPWWANRPDLGTGGIFLVITYLTQ